MAARTLILSLMGLRPTLAAAPVRVVIAKPSIRPISSIKPLFAQATPAQPVQTQNPVSSSMNQSTSPSGQTQPSEPDDGRHSAYLGEADSDDGFESWKDAHGEPHESMDGSNAAFLGEADSDDGFESHKDAHGERMEAIDATQAAFLGEADSDDGFESDRHLNPEKYRHNIEDASGSGAHGEPGEGDH